MAVPGTLQLMFRNIEMTYAFHITLYTSWNFFLWIIIIQRGKFGKVNFNLFS